MHELGIEKEVISIGKIFTLDVQSKIYNLFNEEYRTILRYSIMKRNYYLILILNI